MKEFEKLNRSEMKNVIGGQNGGGFGCTIGSPCVAIGTDQGTGHGQITYPGHCDASCYCIADGGTGQCSNS